MICLRRLFKRRRTKPIEDSSVEGFLIFLCLYLFFFFEARLEYFGRLHPIVRG